MTWRRHIVAAAVLMSAAPALSAPPPQAEIIGDARALLTALPGDWYPVDNTGQPRPKSAFTHGIAACTAPQTATRGADFSVRRGETALEVSIGTGFQPATIARHGDRAIQGIKLHEHIVYLLKPAPDGTPRLWIRDYEGGFDVVYHKCS